MRLAAQNVKRMAKLVGPNERLARELSGDSRLWDVGERLDELQASMGAINELRSNMVATQQAGWSNFCYPLVAILDAAGFDLNYDVTERQAAEHISCYGGAGGYPGNLKGEPSFNATTTARRILSERKALYEKMHGGGPKEFYIAKDGRGSGYVTKDPIGATYGPYTRQEVDAKIDEMGCG